MPEAPLTPGRLELDVDPDTIAPPARAPFVELGLLSCFSFLRGASLPVDLVRVAWALGYDALGIADANSMAGVVRLHTNARKVKLRPVMGCRIETVEGLAFLAYPTDRAAYGRLCRLISAGRMGKLDGEWQDKGACDISLAMLAAHAEGVQLILLPPADLEAELTIGVESNVVDFPSRLREGLGVGPVRIHPLPAPPAGGRGVYGLPHSPTFSITSSNSSQPCAISPPATSTQVTTSPGSTGSMPWRRRTACRCSPPTMFTTTCPTGGRCRT